MEINYDYGKKKRKLAEPIPHSFVAAKRAFILLCDTLQINILHAY